MSFSEELWKSLRGLFVSWKLLLRYPLLLVPFLFPAVAVAGPIYYIAFETGYPSSFWTWSGYVLLLPGLAGLGYYAGSLLMLALLERMESDADHPPLFQQAFGETSLYVIPLAWFWGFAWIIALCVRLFLYLEGLTSSDRRNSNSMGVLEGLPGGHLFSRMNIGGDRLKQAFRTILYLVLPWLVFEKRKADGTAGSVMTATTMLKPGKQMISLFSLIDLTGIVLFLMYVGVWGLWYGEWIRGDLALTLVLGGGGCIWVLMNYIEQFAHGAVYLRRSRRSPNRPGDEVVIEDPDLIDDAIHLEEASRGNRKGRL